MVQNMKFSEPFVERRVENDPRAPLQLEDLGQKRMRWILFFVRIILYGSTQLSNKMHILFRCGKKFI